MPENRDCGRKNLSQMSTEELEQILRQDVEAPADQEADTDFLLDVMEVLAKRDKENSQTEKTAEEAWASFQEHYAPEPEAIRSARPVRPWIRRLIAAAAALVLILCIPVTAHAFDWDELWDVVARWAKETFSFVSGDAEPIETPSSTYAGKYSSLQEFLEKSNRHFSMIPSSIPNNFTLVSTEKHITPSREIFLAVYSDGKREFTLRIQTCLSESFQNIEVDKDSVEIYTVYGTEYYIFSNYGQIQATWLSDSYECILSGELSIDEVKAMIDSIEKG